MFVRAKGNFESGLTDCYQAGVRSETLAIYSFQVFVGANQGGN